MRRRPGTEATYWLVDAIRGAALRSSDVLPFSYACLDLLAIALDSLAVMEVRCCCAPPERVIRTGHAAPLECAPIRLSDEIVLVVRPAAEVTDVNLSGPILERRRQFVAEAIQELRALHPDIHSRLQSDLILAFDAMSRACADYHESTDALDVDDSRVQDDLRIIAHAIRLIATDVEEGIISPGRHMLAPHRLTGNPVSRVLFAFRDFAGSRSRLHVVLTAGQQSLLGSEEQLISLPLSDCPLGAVDGLRTGFARMWALPADSTAGGTVFERLAVEISGSQSADKRLTEARDVRRVLSVPMHLGGLPWLTASMFLDPREADPLWLAAATYRDFLSPLFARLRNSVQDSYRNEVVHQFQTYLAEPPLNIAPLNAHLRLFSRVLPLRPWCLGPVPPDGASDCAQLHEANDDPLHIWSEEHPYIVKGRLIGEQSPWSARPGFLLALVEHVRQLVARHAAVMRAAALSSSQDQARAWAHDVKNWSQPLIRRIDKVFSEGPVTEGQERILGEIRAGLLTLNAVSNAVHWAASLRAGEEPGSGRGFLRPPREYACVLISLALDFLLADRKRVIADYCRLKWERTVSGPSSVGSEFPTAVDLLDPDPRKPQGQVLPRHFIGTLALFREVVSNIRINRDVPGFDEVAVSYSTTLFDDRAETTLIQECIEGAPFTLSPKGVQLANWLYGPGGAGVGLIEASPPVFESAGIPDEPTAQRFRYEVKVTVYLENSAQRKRRREFT